MYLSQLKSKENIRKRLWFFCLVLCMKLRLSMIHSDKTLLCGKHSEGRALCIRNQGLKCYVQMGRYR